MPSKPKRPCSRCGKLATGTCACQVSRVASERKAYDQDRGSAHKRGYTSRWTNYSKLYRRNHPLCVSCLSVGKLTSVEHGGHVDHILPVSGPGDPLFWEPTNHQSLCHACHSVKTAREDGGFANRRGGG